MLFEDGADYDRLEQTDELHIDNLREQIAAHRVQITDKTKGFSFWVKLELTDKEIEVYQRKRRNENEHPRNEGLKNRHMT